jgi:ornithine lipid hydroxylase
MIGLFAAVLVLLERLPVSRFRPARLLRPYLASDVVYLLTGYVALGWLSEPGLRAATGAGAAPWPAMPWGVQLLVAVLAIDLGNYVAHWLMHRSDLLWEFHKVHHSSLHLDWMATFRSHIVEQLLRRGVALVLLVVCGCPIMVVLPAAAVFLAWAMLNHANVRVPLGLLETVFITPRLHRVHHVPATTERNLGTVFTFWDRLRGTLVIGDPSPATPLGLPRERAHYPQDWPRQFVAPWRALAARVGWSPAAGGYTASNSGR